MVEITKYEYKMDNIRELFSEIMTDAQLEKLERLEYFKTPASSKHHLCKQGGLAEHSLNVCNTALNLNTSMNLGIPRNYILMATLLHDLDKVAYYEENILKSGKQSDAQPYKYNPRIVLPHGAGAVYIAMNELDMKLPLPVVTAISYHMSGFQEDFRTSVNSLVNHPVDMILTWLIQVSDQFATWITER